MSAQHTPGPWGVEDYRGDGCRFRVWHDGILIAKIDDDGPDFGEADARLIAAAPDLLEALQAAIAISDKYVFDAGRTAECQSVYDMCSAAIARAIGAA
jgi:hypothetical protein